jgi:uncharacterized protein (TIGR03435 family)
LIWTAAACFGQMPRDDIPEWQTKAGGKLSFEVASVKPSLDQPFRPPSFPLSNDDSFKNTGAHFFADFPLTVYIQFAYKFRPTPEQLQAMTAALPKWVTTDRFTVQASAPGNPTKDQFRLMMQTLLAERFGSKVHFETRREKIFSMMPVKPGKTGPKLIPHESGPPCDSPLPVSKDGLQLPDRCDAFFLFMRGDGLARIGSRNTTLGLLAASLPGTGNLGRPVVDETGLQGRFDFTMEYAAPRPNARLGDAADQESPGPSFVTALREQLGLKLEPTEGPVRELVIDHVDRPTAN